LAGATDVIGNHTCGLPYQYGTVLAKCNSDGTTLTIMFLLKAYAQG
jgi:hypothetical protein